MTPRRTPWEPKAPQRLPKGAAKSAQGGRNEVPKPPNATNKSQNYIHIKKNTQTLDPPTYSGRLIYRFNIMDIMNIDIVHDIGNLIRKNCNVEPKEAVDLRNTLMCQSVTTLADPLVRRFALPRCYGDIVPVRKEVLAICKMGHNA